MWSFYRERGLTLITYLRLLLQVGGGPAQVRPEKKVSVSFDFNLARFGSLFLVKMTKHSFFN